MIWRTTPMRRRAILALVAGVGFLALSESIIFFKGDEWLNQNPLAIVLAVLLGACAIVSLMLFGGWYLEEPLPKPGICPTCGYDLTGLDEGAVCPECGGSRS